MTPYILVIKHFMTPYFSFQKSMTPSIFGTPHSEENDSDRQVGNLHLFFICDILVSRKFPDKYGGREKQISPISAL